MAQAFFFGRQGRFTDRGYWEDINLMGSYHFSDLQLENEYRPLREVEERRAKRKKNTTRHPKRKQAQSMRREMMGRERRTGGRTTDTTAFVTATRATFIVKTATKRAMLHTLHPLPY